MSDDIMGALPPDDDGDLPSLSSYTLMSSSSLEEHSYCASNIEPATVIGDLFENVSSTILHSGLSNDSISFSIGFGDVNLDGFNYSVPSVSASGTGDSMELEDMWNRQNSLTGTTVVEVAASNMDVNNQEEMDSTAGDGKVNPDLSGTSKLLLRGTRRRTDFIEETQKRRNYFELYFRKLITHLHRVESRTGCVGSLTGSFEGKTYGNGVNNADTSLQKVGHVSFVSSDSLGHGTDDHRYAATMLTQNVSSTAVRDHQYDEKTIDHVPDSDTSDYDEDTGTQLKSSRTKRRLYKYEYLKVRCNRDLTFRKLVKSLFNSKFSLQRRTGASFKLLVDYEGCVINENNYENTSIAIAAHRNRLRKTTFNLAPKQVTVQLQPEVSSTSSSTPLTFIIPNFNPVQMTVPCILPPPSGSTIVPLGNISMSAMPNASLQFSDFPSSNNATMCNINVEDFSEILPTVDDVGDPRSSVPCVIRTGDEETLDENNLTVNGSPSPTFIPATEEVEDIAKLLTLTNNSPQNSLEISVSREMKDSSTNTEHICSICCSNNSENSVSHTKELSSRSAFWIRCNDPFCYDMVHASCVGFVVTHSSHLKQLPAFYCKSHR